MVADLSVSLGGFKAATERIETSANNIANRDSTAKLEQDGSFSNEPYRPQTVQTVSQQQGGVTTVRSERDNPTVERYEPSSGVADENGFVEAPNIDPAQEFINLSIASYTAEANLVAIQRQDEIFEATVDIFT